MNADQKWYLRFGTQGDGTALHQLFCHPEVYRFLCDGEPLDRSVVDKWMVKNEKEYAALGIGIWLLEQENGMLAGCVSLERQVDRPRFAELIYALHPDFWGQGLATHHPGFMRW